MSINKSKYITYVKGILMFDDLKFIECDGRKYGAGCKDDCGAFLDYKQCNHINGVCLLGCDAGFQEYLCETGRT